MVREVPRVDGESIKMVGPVAQLSHTPAQIHSAPPRLGENTREILAVELALSPAEIDSLLREKVIGARD